MTRRCSRAHGRSVGSRSGTLVLAALLGCAARAQPAPVATATTAAAPPVLRVHDPHSRADPDEARVTHFALDLTVRFDTKTLEGIALLSIEATPEARRLLLDTRDLTIDAVTDDAGLPLAFELGKPDPILGRSLGIELGPDVRRVAIRYRTHPTAAGLQWLTPEQTAGKKLPFLFTQGEAILTRTWIPCQDSPAIRTTYEARIRVPRTMTAVMSAARKGDPIDEGPERVFSFEMREPIPSYLVALAAGDLAFRALGPRSGVYADPSVIAAAAYELADVEEMIGAAEALFGPYRWGRYDLMLLPPSFPFGGMENPRVTFASPTVLAGDRSLVSLIAHELAHAWSGNLVTNATWGDLWLNEGITVYIEERIDEALYGRDVAEMIEVLGRDSLEEELADFGRDSPKTQLHRNLDGLDPDDNFTGIPYEKGSAFLRLLEREIGRERLDPFLKRYFEHNAFRSMTTAHFVQLVKGDLLEGDRELAARLDVDGWMYGIGLPANMSMPVSKAFRAVEATAAVFARSGQLPSPAPGSASTAQPSAHPYRALEWVYFLRKLPRKIGADKLSALDRAFAETQNAEIRFEWLRLVVENRYEPAFPSLELFLRTQGRRRLVLPLYERLLAFEWGKSVAARIYKKALPLYHPLTRSSIETAFAKMKS